MFYFLEKKKQKTRKAFVPKGFIGLNHNTSNDFFYLWVENKRKDFRYRVWVIGRNKEESKEGRKKWEYVCVCVL